MPSVLVIDNDLGTLESFGRVLRDAGFDVALARTEHGGIEIARRRTIDLVLATLRRAEISGLDALRQLRREGMAIPFVIVTGVVSTGSASEASRLGATDGTPVGADRLLDLVTSLVRPSLSRFTSSEAELVSPLNPQAIHAVQLIEERYREAELTVRSTARELGISTEHLCRLLKRHTGCTFVTILRRARVRGACQLLRTTNLSMKQIADRVGFCSASRFDRDFKKVCGIPPSEYRSPGARRLQRVTSQR